jgi:uncharacterized membrane protein
MKPRIQSVDALRGLIMIIMALDHTRDFFHAGAMLFPPEDLTRTTAAIFFTRWITHFCAPVFMFTAGIGAFFWLNHGGGRTRLQLSEFLVKRGLWLALLDLTVMRIAMTFGKGVVFLTPLWGLGWAMVVLALLIYIPTVPLAVFSVLVIALHNLLDPVNAAQFGPAAWVWNCIHQLGVFRVAGAPVIISYPLMPWFAVMSAGYCFGNVLLLEPARRRRWMLWIGAGVTAAFVINRWVNVYGDPAPWQSGVLSFFRCNKYPPSLDFLLMTLGPAMLVLAWFDGLEFSTKNPLLVFGRVPLFFFVVHFYVLHLLTFPLAWLRYGHVEFLMQPATSMGGPAGTYPARYGYGLPGVYLIWISVVAGLYPLCLWFARVKQRRKDWWLSYL